jgi:hypothetical protein
MAADYRTVRNDFKKYCRPNLGPTVAHEPTDPVGVYSLLSIAFYMFD